MGDGNWVSPAVQHLILAPHRRAPILYVRLKTGHDPIDDSPVRVPRGQSERGSPKPKRARGSISTDNMLGITCLYNKRREK